MAISNSSISSNSSRTTTPFLNNTATSSSSFQRGSSYSVLDIEDGSAAVNWHDNPSEVPALLDVKGIAARASDLFECSICASEFNNSEMAVIPHTTNVRCGAFINNQEICTKCLDRWRQENNTCPFCRDPLQAIPPAEPSRMKRALITAGALFAVVGVATTVIVVCLKSSDII